MHSRPSIPNQWQTPTKRMVLCCGFVGLSFLAIVGLGLLQRIQASENILPDHQVHAAPTKTQPNVVASYGKLPLSFEPNQGQVRGPVQFLSRGRGYTLFLTGQEAVLALRKAGVRGQKPDKQVKQTRPDKVEAFSGFFRQDEVMFKRDSAVPRTAQTLNSEATPPAVLRLRLLGANSKAKVMGLEELPGKSNYFLGNDPKKWRSNIPTYAKVKYREVYPGIDLVYYGNQQRLEYDFVVLPGANPNVITLDIRGAASIEVKAEGDVVLRTKAGNVRLHKPAVYQEVSGLRQTIPGRYVLKGAHKIGFQIGAYDARKPLVIDPTLTYSTFLGGTVTDSGSGIAVDSTGAAYVTGYTASLDFPTTAGVRQGSSGGSYDAFVTKLNASGSEPVYSTYLGGELDDYGVAIAVDSTGSAYITGLASSSDFPTTAGAYKTTGGLFSNGGFFDAFVAKLNPSGSDLVYSTYLGGSDTDEAEAIAVDQNGSAYVTGKTSSSDFPTTPGAFQKTLVGTLGLGTQDAFVAKLNATGSALVYSTYLGGDANFGGFGIQEGAAIAVDSAGSAYVTGDTQAGDFPVTTGGFQAVPGVDSGGFMILNAFVTKLASDGSSLVYSTFLGGGGDVNGTAATGIVLDPTGSAFVTGFTDSTTLPASAGALQSSNHGGIDAFVAELNAAGSKLSYYTYFGGTGDDVSYGIARGSAGTVYMVGGTSSTNFPISSDAFRNGFGGQSTFGCAEFQFFGPSFVPGLPSCGDAFLTIFTPGVSQPAFSTYLGGSNDDVALGVAVDSSGGAYLAGGTASSDFPVSVGAFQPSLRAPSPNTNAFVAKISTVAGRATVVLSATSLDLGSEVIGGTSTPQSVTLTNSGTANLTISSVTLTGTNAGDFAKSADTCSGATVNPSGTCAVSVTFTPTATVTSTGAITITDNASDSPQTVSLTGIGITGSAPVVSTDLATSITSSSAILNGAVNPAGSPGSAYFEWGTDATLTTPFSTTYQTLTANSTTQSFSATISNLATNTTYYYRMVFYNTANYTYQRGSILSFTTATTPTTTLAATSVTSSSAGLNGTINPAGSPGYAYFWWGTDATLSTYNSYYLGSVTANSTTQPFSATISSLQTNTTYYFQMVFDNSANGSYQRGSILSFTTLQSTETTLAATSVTGSSAILNGTVNPAGSPGYAYFWWGTDATLSTYNSYYLGSVTANSTTQPFSATISSLQTNTTYYFQMVFDNSANGSYQRGSILSFTTLQILANVSPTSLTFTSQVGTPSAAQKVTVTNTGTANLTVSGVSLTGVNAGDFGKSADTCSSATVIPNATCAVSVTFTPSAAGSRSASLSFTDNATNSPQTVSLTGTGTTPPIGNPALTLSTNSLNFGVVIVQGSPLPDGTPTTTQTMPITVTNAGTAALTFPSTAFAFTGGLPNEFIVGTGDNACSIGGSLAPNQSCVLYVGFTPQATASRSATLTVSSNPSGSQSVTLTGIGMPYFNQCDTTAEDRVPGQYDGGASTCSYGCALTSGAMVLATFPDLATETPYSLNALANSNGLFSYDSEDSLSDLLSLAELPHYVPDPNLQTSSLNDYSYVSQYLQDHVMGQQQRVILHLHMTGTLVSGTGQCAAGDHYVAVVGPLGSNDWQLADPGWSATHPSGALFSLNGHLVGGFAASNTAGTITCQHTFTVTNILDYGIPSSTNSLEVKALSPIELLVTDSQGRQLGNVSSGVDVFQIPNSSYFRDFPVADDTGSGPAVGDPNGLKTAFISGPSSGPYTVTATGTNSGPYTLAFRGVGSDGSVQETTVSGTASTGSSSQYQVTYSPTPGTPVTVTPLPAVSMSATALTFGSQAVGTTSQAQAVTIMNSGVGPLAISSITIQGDFAQTNSCGTGVAAEANCTINVTFVPTTAGTRTGTLTIVDNAPVSPQMVTLTGTGTGGAVVSLSYSSLTFSAQMSGTSSTAQTVTLTNTGTASLTISSITASGDFSQANTCGTTVSAGANCTITVTFKPTAGGQRTGSISIADNAPDTPQNVALSGTGQDFTFTTPSGSSTSASVAPGQSATYTLSVGGEGGFNQSVSLTCTGAPSEATCTVSPSTLTPGSSATNITVTVTTTAASVGAPRSRPLPPVLPLSPVRGLLMLAMVLGAMAGAIVRRNQPGVGRWQSTVVLLASGLLLTLALAGCGGGGSSAVTHNPGTPAGTYTLTVTGSTGSGSSALSHSVTLTLTVS